MRPLNERWQSGEFHRRLVEIAGAAPGERVLDLGCGQGATLSALLRATAPDGQVVGFDRDEAALARGRGQLGHDVFAPGHLALVAGDLARDLPFPDGCFDLLVCQNVLECVRDRAALVAEAWRVLRPGGRFLLGHHDFDSVTLASSNRDLTRRLVHGFADHKQAWQDVAEGQMGRLLPACLQGSRFRDTATETVTFVDLDLDEGTYARAYLGWVASVAPEIGVAHEDLRAWQGDLSGLARNGMFYFGIQWMYVTASK